MLFFLHEIVKDHGVLRNTVLIDEDDTDFVIVILNDWHNFMKMSAGLFRFNIDHWEEFLRAFLNNPLLGNIVEFSTNEILHLRDEVFIEDVFDVIFSKDVPLEVCALQRWFQILQWNWIELIHDFNQVVALFVIIRVSIRFLFKLELDSDQVLSFSFFNQ